jgi:hypothetical protein
MFVIVANLRLGVSVVNGGGRPVGPADRHD